MTSYLARIWRHIITPICFILFGIGGLLLSLVWFNCLSLFYPNKSKRIYIARLSISYSFRLFLFTAKILGVLNYSYSGISDLKQDKGALVLANHPTLLDYVLIAAVMPRVDCLVKSTLLRNPFVAGVIRACNYLPNNQHDILLTQCKERLSRGDNLLIFPEGTRTTPNMPIHFQRGAANIALRCQSPIRFIHINSSEMALNKQSKWYEIPKRKLQLSLTVGEYTMTNDLIDTTIELPSLQARQLTRSFERKLI